MLAWAVLVDGPERTHMVPVKPFDPARRARQIRDAIAKKKIKRTDITDQILDLIDEIVALEEKKTA